MGCISSSQTLSPKMTSQPIILPPMEYRLLGNTGLKVSVISYGSQVSSENSQQKQNITQNVKKAWNLGINYFDASEQGNNQDTLVQFGEAFKALDVPREDLVISNKIYLSSQGDKGRIRQTNINRKFIKESVKNSLKALQLEYFDIVFCHQYENDTPLNEVAEIARAFTELIREGTIHYWGTSGWNASNIYEIREVCSEKKLIKPSVENPHYNMFAREKLELEYARLFDKKTMGAIVQSPIANGILSGQYNKSGIPANVKWNSFQGYFHLHSLWDKYFTPLKKDSLIKVFQSLSSLANELEMSQQQLALSWVISNKDVSSAVINCSSTRQLEEFVQCIDFYKKITPEIVKKVDQILENTPDQGFNFKTFTPLPSRR